MRQWVSRRSRLGWFGRLCSEVLRLVPQSRRVMPGAHAVTTSLVGQRTPVSIDDGLIRAGSRTTAFDRARPETLLRNYLRLIRRARSQQRAPEISLRREDVDALADFLGVSAESVLHRLATLMGSSRTQRNTMLAAFASGALLVGLSGSVAATSPLLDSTAPSPAGAAASAAIVGDAPPDVLADVSTAPAGSTAPSPVTRTASAPTDRLTSRRSAVVVGGTGADRTARAVPKIARSVPTAAAVGEPANGVPASGQPATQGGSGVSVDDVALVSPVVPDPAEDVAVGDAVVPPSTPAPSDGAANDASDAADPPLTETTVAPIDDIPQELPPVDDETVAVGPPPVPPTTTTVPPATDPVETIP